MAVLGEVLSKYSPDMKGPIELGGLEHLRVSKGVQQMAQNASEKGVDPAPYLIDSAARAVREGRQKIGHFGESLHEPLETLRGEVERTEFVIYHNDALSRPTGDRKA